MTTVMLTSLGKALPSMPRSEQRTCRKTETIFLYIQRFCVFIVKLLKRQGITCVGLGKSIGNATHSKTKNFTNTQDCWMTV